MFAVFPLNDHVHDIECDWPCPRTENDYTDTNRHGCVWKLYNILSENFSYSTRLKANTIYHALKYQIVIF